jgi:amidophosphoribosyltransferase
MNMHQSDDRFHDECGVFGVYGHPEAANLTYLGLYGLQHRGQESAGIASCDGTRIYSHKGMGLVADVFDNESIANLQGSSAIGHVRYSTAGESHIKNAQPFVVEYARGGIAVAHNGNIVNAFVIRAEFEAHGSIFQSSMDTETIVHLMASCRERNLIDRITFALGKLKGAFSLVFLTDKGTMVAARDPLGFRPLCLGRLRDSLIVASETCALDLIEATYIRDVEPGEIIIMDKKGLASYKPFKKQDPRHCIFELIYFARPDSFIFGKSVHAVRKNFGRMLAKENPVDADIVIPVPDSGVPAAIGYAEESGIPFEKGLVRSHYMGRTFIEPQDSIRHFGVKLKLNAVKEALRGKRVVVVDDSIVRGTTSRKIVKMIRDARAKEVHMRISSPPCVFPCYYGIDTPTKEELIASNHRVEEINNYITSDTLSYLSLEGLYRAVGLDVGFCDACFSGTYPVKIEDEVKAPQLVLFK